MKKYFQKAVLVLTVVAVGMIETGCIGSFRLTNKVLDWNKQVSNKKFVNELVFLGFNIIPVYEISILADYLVLNSVEFWGGANPVTMKPGETEVTDVVFKGNLYKVTKTPNNFVVNAVNTGESASFRYFPEEEEWYLMDGNNKVTTISKVKSSKVMKHVSSTEVAAR